MRIAAIYIEDHDYLFSKPQTINFGGQYFYNFTNEGDVIKIQRTLNDKFINGFFNITSLNSKVTNVNAIVGQNGAGKSSLLDIIRSQFTEQSNSFPFFRSVILAESDDSPYLHIIRNDFSEVFLEETKNTNSQYIKVKLENRFPKKSKTIYYSPHFDFKFNLYFDNVDSHDISFDKILDKDLEQLDRKDTKESGWPYTPTEELIFKNSLRQIEFLNSDLVKKYKVFKDIFNLPDHHDYILIFRGYKSKDVWNTPSAYRSALKFINKKVESEINAWTSIRKEKSGKVINQPEINQYILKRNIIGQIISLFYAQMEKKNTFLSEAFISGESFNDVCKDMSAKDALLYFVDKSYIKIQTSNKNIKLFKTSIFQKLISKLYSTIDKAKSEDLVGNCKLKANKNDIDEILKLQKEFLRELYRYYYKTYKPSLLEENDRIDGFINYMPLTGLSSGENALLNLYSRLYNFINDNLIGDFKFYNTFEHYILLLDEADLGFHPTWKKRYVKALLSTIPYFFNDLKNRPSLQIIFTTHDPLTLSDLPNQNVVYIAKDTINEKSTILDYDDPNRPSKTFGANIHDLLKHSFFLKDGSMGEFAVKTINDTIIFLNYNKLTKEIKTLKKSYKKEDAETIKQRTKEANKIKKSIKVFDLQIHKSIISLIDEPILKRKLTQLYDEVIGEITEIDLIDRKIAELQNQKAKLKDKGHA